ncbi:MAG: RluA family pseudouridine synthase [Planctomycetes bacterium]|nr:RluA family pseudouridine synthase [Planctomycetota bacterium]
MARPITILHEDAHLLFCAKPARMLTVAAPGGRAADKGIPLLQRLADQGKELLAVHRLDYETSGVVVFAKDSATKVALEGLFRKREVQKSYILLLPADPSPAHGVIDFKIKDHGATASISKDGKPARTRYECLRSVGPCRLVRAFPETGRHNQIRLHFAHLGLPIVGERKFARGRDSAFKARRVLLHAESLSFTPPHLDHRLRVKAPLPEDFEAALAQIEADPALRRRGPRR